MVGNTGGTTKIVGSKLSVYFNGNLANLDRQIRAGIAEVLVNSILYGGRAYSVIKNGTLLVLPDWYLKGLLAYLSEGWNTDLDNKVNDGVLFDRYYKLNRLSEKDAIIVGHGIWQHIAESYGESSISNVLYMTKVSRNIENAFMFVIGNNSQGLLYEWIDSRARNASRKDTIQSFPTQDPVLLKPKASRDYYQVRII